MKHIIIGTAGHVDHGKTALVKALTGIDTDRLEEEKRRGVTIEPGFAYIDFDEGSRAGIIDVPGHERFIRNMLAGAGGIDLVMLVIAADEGVMPQTREHLVILENLGIKNGLVVLTKKDIVEEDWLELIIDDVKQLIDGTFLKDKSILPVSSFTGDGIIELRNTLFQMLLNSPEKDENIPFRMPVDRVFPVDGFGIVVTGTLIEGVVKIDDTAEIQPYNEKYSVRSIQVHGESVKAAYCGQRTAISLIGIKRGNITRGDVLAAEGSLNSSTVIDVKLTMQKNTSRTIKNGSELHFYHGAKTLLAKVFLFDKTELHKDESGYARLKFKESLPNKRGDKFVVRFFSPMETIGGGVILDSKPVSRLSRNEAMLKALYIKETGSLKEIINQFVYESGSVFSDVDISLRSDIDILKLKPALDELVSDRLVVKLLKDKVISFAILAETGKKCTQLLETYHTENPLRAGISIAELRQKILPDLDVSEANAVLKELEKNNFVELSNNIASLFDFSVSLTPMQNEIYNNLKIEFENDKYDVKTPDELFVMFPKTKETTVRQVFESMISNGELIMLSKQTYWAKDNYDNAILSIKKFMDENGKITLAQCRDILGTTRKFALIFLEYLDGKQVLKMQGDVRVIAKGFDVLQVI